MSDQIVAHQILTSWTQQVFVACGVSEVHAQTTADLLVRTNLRGVESHGVSRVLPYVTKLLSGETNPRPHLHHSVDETLVRFSGDGGLGQIAGMAAINVATELAQKRAFVPVVMHEVGHMGALGMYCLHAARSGMICFLVQATAPSMAPAGSNGAAIGNNPLAFGCPLPDREPFVLDIAMSAASRGKVLLAAREGVPIPLGWAIDGEGNETTDAKRALEGAMLPMADYKGLGLAMMIEILAGSLSGSFANPLSESQGNSASGNVGAFLFLVNPDLFVEQRIFKAHIENWLNRYIRASGPSGRIPGQHASRIEIERIKNGVPLHSTIVSELSQAGELVGVPFLTEAGFQSGVFEPPQDAERN